MFFGGSVLGLRFLTSDGPLDRPHKKVLYKLHLQVKYFTSCITIAMILNRFNEVLYLFENEFGTFALV